jgi:hypothetical protein
MKLGIYLPTQDGALELDDLHYGNSRLLLNDLKPIKFFIISSVGQVRLFLNQLTIDYSDNTVLSTNLIFFGLNSTKTPFFEPVDI